MLSAKKRCVFVSVLLSLALLLTGIMPNIAYAKKTKLVILNEVDCQQIYIGEKKKIELKDEYTNYTFDSSNTEVLKVTKKGKIKGLQAGSAVVRIVDKRNYKINAYLAVTVLMPKDTMTFKNDTFIVVVENPDSFSVLDKLPLGTTRSYAYTDTNGKKLKGTTTYDLTITPEIRKDAITEQVGYGTTNYKVVSVDDYGTLSIKGFGQAKVMAVSGELQATVIVKVVKSDAYDEYPSATASPTATPMPTTAPTEAQTKAKTLVRTVPEVSDIDGMAYWFAQCEEFGKNIGNTDIEADAKSGLSFITSDSRRQEFRTTLLARLRVMCERVSQS